MVYHFHDRNVDYHFLIFGEREVVLAECDDEDDGRDSLEAVDPLFALRPLSTDVEHSVVRISQISYNIVVIGPTQRNGTGP